MRPDFSLIWGSDNAPFTPIEASDYTAGWVFRTGAPPRRVNFDYFQNLSDQRTAWLGEQMLLAVGHEWQSDVEYDAYAVVRSPVDGQLYKSLTAPNLGNEPSVSVSEWQVVTIGSTGAIQQIGAPVYVTATGAVVHPADYTHVLVELVGGGGAGGGAVGNAAHTGGGGGGGAGAYARAMLSVGTVGASTLCTIGAPGVGVTGANGGAGGQTSFGAHLLAGGGIGGVSVTNAATLNTVNGGRGGISTTGAGYASHGGAGSEGFMFGSTSTARGIAGDGGSSFFGAGAKGGVLTGSDAPAGTAAASPGSGGSGGEVGSFSSTSRAGGNGAPGLIRLTYYK